MTGIKKRLGSLLGPQGKPGTDAANVRFDEIEGKADNAVTRIGHIETVAGLAPGEVTDAQTANLFNQPDSLTRAALHQRLPVVTVGPTGEYATLDEIWDDYPEGGVHINLMPGLHTASTIAPAAGFSNVIIEGHGRHVSQLDIAGPLLNSVLGMDDWKFRGFHLNNTIPTNTHDGISSEYPRRWSVRDMHITGYGGDSIWYKGGVNSEAWNNTFFARDATRSNGRSAIHTSALNEDSNTSATTILTSGNYVMGGHQYGYLFENTTIGSSSFGDIAEHCAVGFRFDTSTMTVITPYTEANAEGIEQHDSTLNLMGHVRDTPVVTWSGVAFFSRRSVRVAGNYIDPGRGLLYSGAGREGDFDTSPSLRWDSSNPNGRLAGPVGSLVLRTNGGTGSTLYVKESGNDDTGWTPLGIQSTTTTLLNSQASVVNSQGKQRGQNVFNHTQNRPVWATGSNPSDPWVYADGSTAHSPS